MASIRKRKGSQFWVACYKLPDGQRKQTSTGLTDQNEALQIALKLERASQMSRAGALTREKAFSLVAELAEMGGITIKDPDSIRDTLERYSATRAGGWAEKTKTSFKSIERKFLKYLDKRADLSVSDLTAADIAGYRDELSIQGLKAQTIRGHLKYLRKVLKDLVDQGRIQENPVDNVHILVRSEDSPKRPLPWPKFKELLEKLDGEWHRLVAIGGYTGQRLWDVASLQDTDIDLDRQMIIFRREKNRTNRWHEVPIHPELNTIIRAHKLPQGTIFPELSQCPRNGSRSLSSVFREQILPKIGIIQPYRERDGTLGRTVSAYSFHSLRHMLSTELERAGVSPELRRKIIGHQDLRVSAGYTHVEFKDASRALTKAGKNP